MNIKKETELQLKKELKGRSLKQLLEDQIDDEGLWFISKYITESYLQRALRLIHYAIEKNEKS